MDPTPDGLDLLSRAILRRLSALTNAPKAWTQSTPGGTPRPAGTGAVTQGGRGREAQASMLTGGASHQEMPFAKGVGPSVVPFAKRNVRLADVPPQVARGKGLANHKAPGVPAMAAGRSSRKVRSASAPNRQTRSIY
jgi:hypothetical protein